MRRNSVPIEEWPNDFMCVAKDNFFEERIRRETEC